MEFYLLAMMQPIVESLALLEEFVLLFMLYLVELDFFAGLLGLEGLYFLVEDREFLADEFLSKKLVIDVLLVFFDLFFVFLVLHTILLYLLSQLIQFFFVLLQIVFL